MAELINFSKNLHIMTLVDETWLVLYMQFKVNQKANLAEAFREQSKSLMPNEERQSCILIRYINLSSMIMVIT